MSAKNATGHKPGRMQLSPFEIKDELIMILAEPPVDPSANLPPGVEFPPGEFHGGLQARYQVVAVNPLMDEEAGHAVLLLTVVTSSGTYTDTLDVHATLPWKVASGQFGALDFDIWLCLEFRNWDLALGQRG